MLHKIDSFTDYLLHNKRFSAHTVSAYRTDLEQFFSFLDKSITDSLALINHKKIRNWIMELKKDAYSPVSINRKIISLRSFFKYAILKGWITSNPTSKIIALKTAKKLPGSISEDSMIDLFNYRKFDNNFTGVRDKAILLTFYCTGIRLTELLNLTIEKVDLERKTIKVLGKRNKERVIPIQGDLVTLLKKLIGLNYDLKPSTSFLFINDKGKQLYSKQVYNIVRKYLSEVTTHSNASPHLLRHTFATHMLENKAGISAIKELLGHSSLAATQLYTNNSIKELKQIYKQSHPRGK